MKVPPASLELDIKRLTAAIEEKRVSLGLTHYQVANQVGVSYDTYNLWRYHGTSMRGGAAVRVSAWLGRDLREFTRKRTGPIPEYRGKAA